MIHHTWTSTDVPEYKDEGGVMTGGTRADARDEGVGGREEPQGGADDKEGGACKQVPGGRGGVVAPSWEVSHCHLSPSMSVYLHVLVAEVAVP